MQSNSMPSTPKIPSVLQASILKVRKQRNAANSRVGTVARYCHARRKCWRHAHCRRLANLHCRHGWVRQLRQQIAFRCKKRLMRCRCHGGGVALMIRNVEAAAATVGNCSKGAAWPACHCVLQIRFKKTKGGYTRRNKCPVEHQMPSVR